MRTYMETHPWMTFRLTLKELPAEVWILLGEAISKCEHISGVPLQPAVATKLNEIYLSKGAHATTQIEGNTLSEAEVQRRVRHDLDLPPSKEYLGVEIDNVVKAYNRIISDVLQGRPLKLTPERIKEFNRLVLDGLPQKEGVVPGEIRTHSVLVGNTYRGAPAGECEELLDRLCSLVEDLTSAPAHLQKPVALLAAMVAHLYLAWIHPFGDGNGRTARLIEFQLIVATGAPTVAAHVLSDHYNATRTEYYRQLDLTSRPPFSLNGFLQYGLQGFTDGLRAQIEAIRQQQMVVAWENFVHAEFDGLDTPALLRQRRLVLDLPWDKFTNMADIAMLTPRLALAYAGKGERTIPRDVNALEKRKLVIKHGRRVMPYTDQLRAFLPPSVQH